MSDIPKSPAKIGLGAVLFVMLIALALRSLFVMLAWNYVVPDLFGLSKLTYLNSVSLFITVSLLFGSLVPSNRIGKE